MGGTGFLVDAGLLALLIHGGWTPLPARLVSILVALTVTWQLNRRVTFAMSGAGSVGEFGQYLSLGAATSGFNYAIYAALIASGRDTLTVRRADGGIGGRDGRDVRWA